MTLQPSVRVVGAQRPRFASRPDFVTSAGDEAIELAATAGLVLDEWQCYVLREALGESANGRWTAFQVGLVVPRQNGKGAILEALILAALYLFDDEMTIYSAHEFKTAQETFRRVIGLIEGADHLRQSVLRKVQSTNEMGLELRTGQRLRFLARSAGSGRGFSGSRVILDEAYNLSATMMAALMPVMSTKPNPQIWYTSSAGQAGSAHLRFIRDLGRAGNTARLAYFEWSATEGADLDDEAAWAQANPSLNLPTQHSITSEYVVDERAALASAEAEWARERLGWWDEAGGVPLIDLSSWVDCADHASTVNDPVCVGIEVALDRASSSIGIAGVRPDSLPGVELAAQQPGTAWVVPRVVEMCGRSSVTSVSLDPSSPAGSLIPEFEAAGIEILTPTGRQVAQACGAFYDAVMTGQLRHRATGVLTTAALAASKYKVGDSWRWDRYGPDVSSLYAVTLALHAQQNQPDYDVLKSFY